MKLYFVTTNDKKKKELEACLSLPVEQLSIDIQEIQGTKEEVALDKLQKALKGNEDKIVIIDDTSIEIKAMNGFPGPYGKDFIKIGFDVIEKIVEKIGRETVASTMIGIGYYKDGRPIYKLFEGCLDGFIVKTDYVDCFGFDGVFLPKGQTKVYGEMSLEEKNAISHRGLACKKLKEYLLNNKLI
ncbi:Inosine triphosphate pyrophosphatase [Nosema granulosis]|uniref:Inosine triphosphate pyrophosphatase n=1 Tax=Nosema granulosis TaxID=83296 RepID=A0A9P6KZI6_9MICR|nr:Inosine triphosphate pyrophosphatase [Nosema granulosis]